MRLHVCPGDNTCIDLSEWTGEYGVAAEGGACGHGSRWDRRDCHRLRILPSCVLLKSRVPRCAALRVSLSELCARVLLPLWERDFDERRWRRRGARAHTRRVEETEETASAPSRWAARRSACVLHAVAMFVQQQVAVLVACVWRAPAVVCVREELLLLERAIAAPVLSRPQCSYAALQIQSTEGATQAAGIGGAIVTHGGAFFHLPQHPRRHFFSNLL